MFDTHTHIAHLHSFLTLKSLNFNIFSTILLTKFNSHPSNWRIVYRTSTMKDLMMLLWLRRLLNHVWRVEQIPVFFFLTLDFVYSSTWVDPSKFDLLPVAIPIHFNLIWLTNIKFETMTRTYKLLQCSFEFFLLFIVLSCWWGGHFNIIILSSVVYKRAHARGSHSSNAWMNERM